MKVDKPNISDFTNANHDHTTVAQGGLLEGYIWSDIIGSYASTSSFTFTGNDEDVGLIQLSLFWCTNSAGTLRRIGYIKSSVNAAGTITASVVSDTDLAAGDANFHIAY